MSVFNHRHPSTFGRACWIRETKHGCQVPTNVAKNCKQKNIPWVQWVQLWKADWCGGWDVAYRVAYHDHHIIIVVQQTLLMFLVSSVFWTSVIYPWNWDAKFIILHVYLDICCWLVFVMERTIQIYLVHRDANNARKFAKWWSPYSG